MKLLQESISTELSEPSKHLVSDKIKMVIYPHLPFRLTDGGIFVQYYLAKCLKELGHDVKICDNYGRTANIIFNDYISASSVSEDSIVLYCEGIEGNPLKKKKVIRWLLSELGQNVPYNRLYSWGKDELVYFFSTEVRFKNKPDFVGTIYKTLNVLYTDPIFLEKPKTGPRSGWCHTFRKHKVFHDSLKTLHPRNSKEIKHMPFKEMSNLFQRSECFISYDPITFLSILAALSGCISIIYPIKGCNKESWLQKTSMWDYLVANNLGTNIYGIAYGLEDIAYARQTLHLVHDQQASINDFMMRKSLSTIVNDLGNFGTTPNTIENVYHKPINTFSIKPDEIKSCTYGFITKVDVTHTFINLLRSHPNSITISPAVLGLNPGGYNVQEMRKLFIVKKDGDVREYHQNDILLLDS